MKPRNIKRWIEKHAIGIGYGFMAAYLCFAIAMIIFTVFTVDQWPGRRAQFVLTFLQGFAFLMSIKWVWNGATRLANPKLKVRYTRYKRESVRTDDGQDLHWSKPDGERTATYSRPFALLSLVIGLGIYGGMLALTLALGAEPNGNGGDHADHADHPVEAKKMRSP